MCTIFLFFLSDQCLKLRNYFLYKLISILIILNPKFYYYWLKTLLSLSINESSYLNFVVHGDQLPLKRSIQTLSMIWNTFISTFIHKKFFKRHNLQRLLQLTIKQFTFSFKWHVFLTVHLWKNSLKMDCPWFLYLWNVNSRYFKKVRFLFPSIYSYFRKIYEFCAVDKELRSL